MSTISHGWAFFPSQNRNLHCSIQSCSSQNLKWPQKVFYNSTEFMQSNTATATARGLESSNSWILGNVLRLPDTCWLLLTTGVHTWKQLRNIPWQAQEIRRHNNQRAFLHYYNWIMEKMFASSPSQALFSFGQEQERDVWWQNHPCRGQHALACSSGSREASTSVHHKN